MINTRFSVAVGLALTVCTLATTTTFAQTTVRVHGATTASKLLLAKKEAIETKTGVKLEVVGNGSGRGLTDLIAGSADIAMVGSSLKATAAAMNKEKPGSVEVSGLTEIPLNKVKLNLIVHPSAGIKTLTLSQLSSVLTGATRNWKEVGGSDVPIKLVIPFVGDGARTSVQDAVMDGADFAKDAIVRSLSKEIYPIVAQLPGACGFVSAKNTEGNVTVCSTDKEFFMPMVLVVKGEPSSDIKKVVEETRPLFVE